MIDNLLKQIVEQVKAKNTYLNKLNTNCILNDNNQVVADYNRMEVYEGASDLVGIGGYIRYNGKFAYSIVSGRSLNNKKTSSCETSHGVQVPLRLVVYNFEGGKEFNQARLEEKLVNDLQGIEFDEEEGYETQLQIAITGSDINSHAVFKAEMGSIQKSGDAFFQMLYVDFNLNFVRQYMKEDCLENCDVFNNSEKC